MIRYTTPWHYFKFPVDPAARFSEIEITYRQNEENLLVKHKSDLAFYNAGTEDEPIYTGKYRLTQEETALFRGSRPGDTQRKNDVYIQIRVLTTGGDSLASKPYRVPVADVLNGTVLRGEAVTNDP